MSWVRHWLTEAQLRKCKNMTERLTIGSLSSALEEEHLLRYQFAAKFVLDKDVLDIACGTGYGSRILADHGARSVVGADISAEAVEFAKNHYSGPRVRFEIADAQTLEQFDDAVFDAVISFETIEHVPEDEGCLRAVHRVLKPGGLYIVSTPDRRPGSIKGQLSKRPANPFHIREYTRSELVALLGNYFEVDGLFGQNFVSRLACFLPVQIVIKSLCYLFRRLGAQEYSHRLYYVGTGPAIRPESDHGLSIPNYWVARCIRRN
jgi:SAM-dependent methyltransferase